MKRNALNLTMLVLPFVLAGCIASPPEPTAPPTTPPTALETQTLTYAVSTADKQTYCNGADMDSYGYAKTFTKRKTMTVSPIDSVDPLTAVINMATKDICREELMTSWSFVVKDGVLNVSPYEGWAGVSIHDCACRPAVEQTAYVQPGIKEVRWISDPVAWDQLTGKLPEDKILEEKNGRVYVHYQGKKYSFKGEASKLEFFESTEALQSAMYYDKMEIGTTFAGPYAVYNAADLQKASFTCDGSFHTYADTGKDLVHTGCTTNGTDTLTQYEFSAASVYPMTTGGEVVESWQQITLKKINGMNVAFVTDLSSAFPERPFNQSWADFELRGTPEYLTVSSTKTLDTILKDPTIQEVQSLHQSVIDSFRAE